MNLILFESNHSEISLPATDPRAKHITGVLRRRVGDVFDAGVINGARGKGTVQNVSDGALELTFAWGAEPRSADPITLVVGLPRPQTARRILQETTSLGVERMYFARTKRGEASYGSSKLWSTGEWRRHLIAGAEQAFTTRLPEVSWGEELSSVIESLRDKTCRIALDNYESPESIARGQSRVSHRDRDRARTRVVAGRTSPAACGTVRIRASRFKAASRRHGMPRCDRGRPVATGPD